MTEVGGFRKGFALSLRKSEGKKVVLDDLKHHSRTVGMKQTMKAVEANKVRTVYVAKDAEERVVSKLLSACMEKGVQIHKADSMKTLGKACGIDVGTAVAALIND